LDHAYIEERSVAERYLSKDLSDTELREFESHFPDCPECMDRLVLAEVFRSARDGSPKLAQVYENKLAFSSRPRLNLRRAVLLLGAAAFVLLAIPSTLFLAALRESREQLVSQGAGGPVPLYFLEPKAETPVARTSGAEVVLAIPGLDAPPGAPLRADLVRGDVRLVWTANFQAGPSTIAFRIPAAHFEEGALRLDIIARDPAGRSSRLAFFRIRVN
jgi:hypothetical protein